MDKGASEGGCLCLEQLERAFPFFGTVGANEVEVVPVSGDLGEEVIWTAELFAIEKLIFDQTMNRLDVALPGIAFGWNEAMI